VSVSRPAVEVRERVITLADSAAALLGRSERLMVDEVVIHDGFLGPGYGVPSVEGGAALALAATCEGVLLDPTYTAKALAGYRALVRAGRYRGVATTLFVHTGGLPSLFVSGDGPR
jgi:D-cysteine desulfhydrase